MGCWSSSRIRSKMRLIPQWWIGALMSARRKNCTLRSTKSIQARGNTSKGRYLMILRRSTCCSMKKDCILNRFRKVKWRWMRTQEIRMPVNYMKISTLIKTSLSKKMRIDCICSIYFILINWVCPIRSLISPLVISIAISSSTVISKIQLKEVFSTSNRLIILAASLFSKFTRMRIWRVILKRFLFSRSLMNSRNQSTKI